MPSPLFLAARAVVNAEDPLGLLALDAPEDEYDAEVLDLVKWRTVLAPSDVNGVFVRWFGLDGQLDAGQAQRIADRINAARAELEAGKQ